MTFLTFPGVNFISAPNKCADSPETLLLAYAIVIKNSCIGSFQQVLANDETSAGGQEHDSNYDSAFISTH